MITISKKTEYSLILIQYLGNKDAAETVSLTEVARETHMPYRFLSQLASSLKQGGVLISKEGKSGGYSLVDNYSEISMYELLKVLGEDKHMVACLGGNICSREGSCKARKVWVRLEEKMVEELKKIKLGEI